MEFVKANLHMERSKCQIQSQLTLEEDKTISDRNPDAQAILLERTCILDKEVRPGKDVVLVKGKLSYELLLRSQEGCGLYRVQGELPFEEKIRAEGVEASDQAEVFVQVEDFRTGLINSRKISIRGLLRFDVEAWQLYDEEIPISILRGQGLEVKREKIEQSVLAVQGKDILRVREEVELTANLPPIQEILWKSVELRKWEIHTLEDRIGVQGEIHLFLLYEGEGEGQPIRQFSSILPFSQNVSCSGSRSGMQPEIQPSVASCDLNVREDSDGETRLLDMEMVLELPIRLMENREWEMITDVYAITQETMPEYVLGDRRVLQERQQGRLKLSQLLSTTSFSSKVLQVCHVEGYLLPQEIQAEGKSLRLEGSIALSVLCLTENEEKPYEVISGEIAYSHSLDDRMLTQRSFWKVIPVLESLKGTLMDGENLEVKAVVGLEILLGERWEQKIITGVRLEPLSPERVNSLPGMVVYFADGEESLWDVGKKYLVSADSIKELNQLEAETLQKGQKVLLVKEVMG